MKRILWIATRWMAQLGRSGMLGMILLLLACALYLGGILPALSKSQQLSAQIAAEREQQKTSGQNTQAVDDHSVDAQLHAFYAFFPDHKLAPKQIGRIYAAAQAATVTLEEGQYKYSRLAQGGMTKYEITLPVNGSYVQIRKFIVKVLNTVPTAALADIDFKRDSVGSGSVGANISFTLYLGGNT